MKKLSLVGILICIVIVSQTVHGQDMGELVKGSVKDANYLVAGYATPFIKAFGTGLNQGWYNTADTHKFPGADLTLSVSLIGVPSADKIFAVDPNKLETLQLNGPSNNIPTFFGSSEPTGQTLSPKGFTTPAYTVPPGADLPIKRVPVPIANLGIGLPKGIDIIVRYVPTLNLGEVGSLGLWGVGIKHDIKQHIPGLKALPFSMSIFAGYTKFNSKLDLDKTQNQVANFYVNSTTMQLLVSKKLAVLTIYGGVGYDITNGSLNLKGDYNTGSGTVKDPVDFSAKHNSGRFTGGLRLKLGPITLHGDYTLAKYSAITAGFGINIR